MAKMAPIIAPAIFLLIVLSFAGPAFAQNPAQDPRPSITITKPSYCTSTIPEGRLTVKGTASSDIGIKRVEAFVHTYPFNNHFPFLLANPVSEGDWSSWSISLDIAGAGQQRILAKVVDNNDNENWAEVVFNVVANSSGMSSEGTSETKNSNATKQIAFVDPTFTDAAYNKDGFYYFYFKYNDVKEGVPITTDLNYMTGQIPREADRAYFAPIVERVKAEKSAQVSIIRDQDVHAGILFERDGSRAFDTLILLHNEYVTQKEYNQFKGFVESGGAIIFLDPNIFYAEVKYDEDSCVVTLVKGHDWEFDGKSVKKSVAERYFEENKEWVGSNFVVRDIRDPVEFANNPFGYTHFEENYVNNPNAQVLLDYKATFIDPQGQTKKSDPPLILQGVLRDLFGIKDGEYLDESHKEAQAKRIATYQLDYGKGKVLMLGIYGQNLANNTKFLDFLDSIILTRAIGTPYNLSVAGNTSDAASHNFTIYWKMSSGNVSEISLDKEQKKLNIRLERYNTTNDDLLTLVLPKALIDASDKTRFSIVINNTTSPYSQVSDDIETAIVVPVSGDSTEIEIYGAKIVPEFAGSILIMCIAVAAVIAFTVAGKKSRLFSGF
jgi:hypothetical protein